MQPAVRQRALDELFHPPKDQLPSQTNVKLIEEKEKIAREKRRLKEERARKREEKKREEEGTQTESEVIVTI